MTRDVFYCCMTKSPRGELFCANIYFSTTTPNPNHSNYFNGAAGTAVTLNVSIVTEAAHVSPSYKSNPQSSLKRCYSFASSFLPTPTSRPTLPTVHVHSLICALTPSFSGQLWLARTSTRYPSGPRPSHHRTRRPHHPDSPCASANRPACFMHS